MPSAQQPHTRSSVSAQPEIAAAEILAWVSECLEGGLCFVSRGILVFENPQFGELVEIPAQTPDPSGRCSGELPSLRASLFADAITWNDEPLGSRQAKTYRLINQQFKPQVRPEKKEEAATSTANIESMGPVVVTLQEEVRTLVQNNNVQAANIIKGMIR